MGRVEKAREMPGCLDAYNLIIIVVLRQRFIRMRIRQSNQSDEMTHTSKSDNVSLSVHALVLSVMCVNRKINTSVRPYIK